MCELWMGDEMANRPYGPKDSGSALMDWIGPHGLRIQISLEHRSKADTDAAEAIALK